MDLKNVFVVVAVLLILGVASVMVPAQDEAFPRWGVSPDRPLPVAAGSNLYCAGFIQTAAISTENRIVGANDEADKHVFAQNDFLYINMGHDKGVNVGDMFAVVRPRGKVKSSWTRKSGLGFYVQEVGAVEVVSVKNNVSVARVKNSCETFLLGDLIQLTAKRNPPMFEARPALDQFGDPSGRATGRIVLARDNAEMMARDFIVYVDLGADDNVRAGDHLTIFRPLGKGNVYKGPERGTVDSGDYGFKSLVYKGGTFSNQSPRRDGEHAGGGIVSEHDAKKGRPDLRKVVGEAVVINVKEKTATVVITRNVQEIHTGDWVEIQ